MTNEATTEIPTPSIEPNSKDGQTPNIPSGNAPAEPTTTTTPKVYKKELASWSGKALEVVNKANQSKLSLIPQVTTRGHKASYPGLDESTTDWELIEGWMNTEKEPDNFRRWVIEKFNDELLIVWRTHQDEAKFITAITDPNIQRTPKSLSVYYNRLLTLKQKEIKENQTKWTAEQRKVAIDERKVLFAQYQEALEKELEKEMEMDSTPKA